MDEMESMRIEGELEKQNLTTNIVRFADNRDSGVADVDDAKSSSSASSSSPNHDVVKRSVLLSNSLLDMSEQQAMKREYLDILTGGSDDERRSFVSLQNRRSVEGCQQARWTVECVLRARRSPVLRVRPPPRTRSFSQTDQILALREFLLSQE